MLMIWTPLKPVAGRTLLLPGPTMHGVTVTESTESRPDALADLPGICDLPLTRAVVQYRDVHELRHPGGQIRDIGLALVLAGRFASSSRVVDLGSGEIKYLNLTSELVILDWVYEPTVAHLQLLGETAERSPARAVQLRRFCFDLALRILNRRGFSPLTRPILLRIGFRDICRDLDLHESTLVRIMTGPRAITRIHLDYEANSLVFRTPRPGSADGFDRSLRAAFGGLPVERARRPSGDGYEVCKVRLGVPVTFGEVLHGLHAMRRGLSRLVERYEPERFGTVSGLTSTFGERATLDRLTFREPDFGVIAGGFDDMATSVH